MNVDDSNFRKKLERMQQARRGARHAAVEFIGRRLAQQILLHAPKDTRRFVRGYLVGLQKIGHFKGSLPALQRSKYIGAAIKLLVEQYELWNDTANKRRERIRERYPNGAPRGQRAAYNKLMSGLKKAQDRAARAREELEKYRDAPYGIIMSPLRWAWSPKDRHLVTVRPRPYGGVAALVDTATATKVRLLTQEPHAEFVERRDHVLAQAIAAATAGTTFAKSAKVYVKGIKTVAQVQGAERARFLAGE